MRAPVSRRLTSVWVLAASLAARPALAAPPPPETRGWLGEELPLPLAVRTAQDLAVKAAAEKQYLIFNLLAGGKLAWDAGDFATAATKWEALLRVHGLDPEIEKVIRPLAKEARGRAGGAAVVSAPPIATPAPEASAPGETEPRAPMPIGATVSGTVSGGGSHGPGGAVIWLKRIGGETPRTARSSPSATRPSSLTCWSCRSGRRSASATRIRSFTTSFRCRSRTN